MWGFQLVPVPEPVSGGLPEPVHLYCLACGLNPYIDGSPSSLAAVSLGPRASTPGLQAAADVILHAIGLGVKTFWSRFCNTRPQCSRTSAALAAARES